MCSTRNLKASLFSFQSSFKKYPICRFLFITVRLDLAVTQILTITDQNCFVRSQMNAVSSMQPFHNYLFTTFLHSKLVLVIAYFRKERWPGTRVGAQAFMGLFSKIIHTVSCKCKLISKGIWVWNIPSKLSYQAIWLSMIKACLKIVNYLLSELSINI